MDDSPILVIDDDVELCELLVDYLGAEGFTVHVCHDGPAGLTRLEGARYGLVVLDVMLPGLNGFEVLRRMRECSTLKTVPVVMLTSSREERDIAQSYDLGVNAYVVKPVDFRAFVHAITELGVFWAVVNQPPPSLVAPAGASA
mgnify:CR=1 FL=1